MQSTLVSMLSKFLNQVKMPIAVIHVKNIFIACLVVKLY